MDSVQWRKHVYHPHSPNFYTRDVADDNCKMLDLMTDWEPAESLSRVISLRSVIPAINETKPFKVKGLR